MPPSIRGNLNRERICPRWDVLYLAEFVWVDHALQNTIKISRLILYVQIQ